MGLRPSSCAFAADVNMSADAPSLSGDALAAVIVPVPSVTNAGLSAGTFSYTTRRNSSSSRTSVSPFFSRTLTGAISASNVPRAHARSARR